MPPSTQTTTSSSEPWGPQKKAGSLGIRDAMRAYKGGFGSNTGSMVVPWAKQTQQGMGGTMDVANQNAGMNGMGGQFQDIINNGGFNDYQKGSLDNWQKTANSAYDFNANPGSQGVLDSILRDTTNSVNGNAAAAGRYGSGVHQGRLAQDVGDQSSQFRMNDFNTFLGRKDAANSNLFNGAQTGMSNMTSAYAAQKQPYQDMMGIGSMNEDLKRRQLDDRARINNLPWENIQKLLAASSGAGNYGTTTTQAPGPNPFLQGLGMAGSAGNFLWGSGTGGLLGQL